MSGAVRCNNDLMNAFNYRSEQMLKQNTGLGRQGTSEGPPGTPSEVLRSRERSLVGTVAFRGIRGGSSHFI